MKQSRVKPIVRSVVVLGFFSAGLTRGAVSQKPPDEEPVSSSQPHNDLVASALFAPMLPDAPGAVAARPATPVAPRRKVETSVSLGTFAQITTTRADVTGGGGFTAQSLNASAGALGTFRQSYRPLLGYSVNMGYLRSTENNTFSNFPLPFRFDIPNNIYELSASYVAQTKLQHKLTGFADVGAGMLAFLPVHRGADASNYVPNQSRSLVPPVTFRPTGVFGLGVDYHFSPQLALRAEYRAQLYKFADYGIGLPRLMTYTSEPTISLAYTFGKHAYKQ